MPQKLYDFIAPIIAVAIAYFFALRTGRKKENHG